MKRVAFAVVPLLALALPAFAQQGKNVTTVADNADTVKVTVSGGADLDYVYRSPGMTHVIGLNSGAGEDGETTVEGQVYAGFGIELNDKISAVFEFGTKGVDGGATTYYGVATGTAAGTTSPVGAPTAIVLREAHVNLSEFLSPNLTAQLGLTTWSFDVRGKGSSFAFDPRHSSSFAKNASPLGDGGVPGGTVPNLLDEMDTMGSWFTYSQDQWKLDIVLLPVVLDGGTASADEALYAVDFMYSLDDQGSQAGAILALVSLGPNGPGGVSAPNNDVVGSGDTAIFTLGGGATLHGLMPNLEVYGELYFQFGDAGQNATDGDDLDAGGVAFQVGAEYNLGGPWIGGNITYVSGDDSTSGAFATDDDVERFMSYEAINDLAILEDMYWGFDIDSNYFAFKATGGIPFSFAGGQDNFELSGILGIASTNEDVEFAAPVSDADKLGTEVDVKAQWNINSQFNLHTAVAFLFGSDVLESTMEANGSDDEEDSAFLWYLGFGLGF